MKRKLRRYCVWTKTGHLVCTFENFRDVDNHQEVIAQEAAESFVRTRFFSEDFVVLPEGKKPFLYRAKKGRITRP